jgi:hypothetical protein
MDKAEIIFSMIFIANDETAEIMHPGKQAFDPPAFGVPA